MWGRNPRKGRDQILPSGNTVHRKYVESAGGEVAVPADGNAVAVVEISPLLSYAEENLGQLVKGRRLEAPVQLG